MEKTNYKRFGKNAEFDKYVGGCLREYRESTGMEIKEVAAKAGISYQVLSSYELGRYHMSLYVVTVLAYVYGLQPDELVYIMTEGLNLKPKKIK